MLCSGRSTAQPTRINGSSPCTARAKERGELITLQPGETRVYDLELGALDGEAAIDAFAARVAAVEVE